MKCMKVVLGSVMLALAPLAALADDMSYSYVDLAYVETDIDGFGASADGFALRGSVGFAENFFVSALYADQSIDVFDIESIAVGVGGHYGINDSLDLVGSASYTEVDLSGPGINGSDDGYQVNFGARGQVGDAVELEGGVLYQDLSDGGDSTSLYVGGRFHFNKTWALGAEYMDGDDASVILAYVRASF